MPFGIKFFDDALLGIMPGDLILVGARSGAGKTQLCTNIALANIAAGRKPYFIALEAERFEIESRLKFKLVMDLFYADPKRPVLNRRIGFQEWFCGQVSALMAPYEEKAHHAFASAFEKLFVFYKQGTFGIADLTEQILVHSQDKDLVIIDHAHYFDFEDDNENRAMKQLARTVRTLALEENKPIILVAHLRKRDRGNQDLAPDLDEFHGSSDLSKIATRVITLAPGRMGADGRFETFFRIPKNRFDGGATRFMAQAVFNPRENSYDDAYKIGWADQSRADGFAELDRNLWPAWSRGEALLGGGVRADAPGQPAPAGPGGWEEAFASGKALRNGL